MRVELFNPDEDKPAICLVRLVPACDRIILTVVDAKGKCMPRGRLLGLDSHGVHLYEHVNPDFGLALDERGRLKQHPDV